MLCKRASSERITHLLPMFYDAKISLNILDVFLVLFHLFLICLKKKYSCTLCMISFVLFMFESN